jgi:hypothetical protein
MIAVGMGHEIVVDSDEKVDDSIINPALAAAPILLN